MARHPVGRSRRRATLAVATLTALGLLAHGGPAGAQVVRAPAAGARIAPPAFAEVVDALGRVVGPVLGLVGKRPVILLRAEGRDAAVMVDPDRLQSHLYQLAQYESTDCTGPPWIEDAPPAPLAGPLVEQAVIGRLNELLVANGDPETRTLRSHWEPGLTPKCDEKTFPENLIVRPTRVLLDLDTFAPPFRLR